MDLRRFVVLLGLILALPVLASAQRGVRDTRDSVQTSEVASVRFDATSSFWFLLHEAAQNGLIQPGSGDLADSHASGFSFRHGRVGITVGLPGGDFGIRLRLRLEERTDISDFYGSWTPSPLLNVYLGQMKIPSTAEARSPYDQLDFVSRSTFSTRVADLALTRTPYISSLMAAKSSNRDLGLAVKGSWRAHEQRGISWFLFVGNGLGANRYIGARENSEFLFTNSFGEFYYGARIDFHAHKNITVGLHASLNDHDDVALGERGPVFDIRRKVWTADLTAALPGGPRLYAFYGQGDIDDFFDTQRYLYDYSGWGAQLVYPLGRIPIQFALRFDRFSSESNRDGNETTQDNWTSGILYSPSANTRIHLNYILKRTNNEFEADIDDDLLLLSSQMFFSEEIGR